MTNYNLYNISSKYCDYNDIIHLLPKISILYENIINELTNVLYKNDFYSIWSTPSGKSDPYNLEIFNIIKEQLSTTKLSINYNTGLLNISINKLFKFGNIEYDIHKGNWSYENYIEFSSISIPSLISHIQKYDNIKQEINKTINSLNITSFSCNKYSPEYVLGLNNRLRAISLINILKVFDTFIYENTIDFINSVDKQLVHFGNSLDNDYFSKDDLLLNNINYQLLEFGCESTITTISNFINKIIDTICRFISYLYNKIKNIVL